MLRGLYDQRKTKDRMWNNSSREPVTLANQLLCDSRGTYGETEALAKLRERLLVPAGYLDGLEIVSSSELGKELATRQAIVHQLYLAILISQGTLFTTNIISLLAGLTAHNGVVF
jgi:hypothetical protein